MTALSTDIAAYETKRDDLELHHAGRWALFHAGEFVGVYDDFEGAATEAEDRFGEGPYLIRQVGVEEIRLSSTMVFRPSHAPSASRL